MKRLSIVSLGVLLPVLVSATSITEVVQQTIEKNPKIKVSKEKLGIAKKGIDQSKADYLPSLDLSYSVGPEYTKASANNGQSNSTTRQSVSATLKQNLFRGFDTKYAVKQQEALVLSASDGVKDSANELAYEVISAYVEVLKMKSLYDVAKENVAVHEKYLAQIKEKVDGGVGRASDYKQTLSRFENAKGVELIAQENYENALYSYQRILPGDVSVSEMEEPTVGQLPAEDIESLVQIAMHNSPAIKVSLDDVEAAKAGLERADSSFYPTVDLELQAYWTKNVHGIDYATSTNPNPYAEDYGQNALLVLNYNVFNGFYDQAKKEANQHMWLKQGAVLADSKLYVDAHTKIAYNSFKLTKAQLIHMQNNVASTKETVEDYRQENELGRRSIIDLLNIELEHNSARNLYTETKYDHTLVYYELLKHTGKLLEEMNVVVK